MYLQLTRWAAPLLALAMAQAGAQAQFRQAHPRLGNVTAAFDTLAVYPEPLSFRMGSGIHGAPLPRLTDGAEMKTHYQGIQRWTGGGVPYLFVSRSGMVEEDYGNVLIVRMGSRERDGERMRSNRLRLDTDTTYTPGEGEDEVVGEIRFDYKHPGGMQICGDILAVPLEEPIGDDLPTGRIEFYNIADPENPQLLNGAINASHNFGVVGMVKLPDGHFLVVATWGGNSQLNFFRSNGTDFNAPGFHFELHDIWYPVELPPDNGAIWPVGTDVRTSYQSLSLLVQGDGRVFMIGARNTSVAAPILNGDDLMDLYEIEGFEADATRIHLAGVRGGAHKICSSGGDSPGAPGSHVNADFLAGSGTYITPSGELLFYAIEHWNLGPVRDSARFVEFRHQDLYRPNGPAYQKQVDAGGPYQVNEGSSVLLQGRGRGPIVQPWIQLFEDSNYQGRTILMEWPDHEKENYEDLGKIDDFDDRTSSFRFWLPAGWVVILYSDKGFSSTQALYAGNGTVVGVSDFGSFGVSSIEMIPPASAPPPPKFTWEILNPEPNTGSLSQTAIPTEADFEAVDGPATVEAQLRAAPEPIVTENALIEVLNVEPVITAATLTPGGTLGSVSLEAAVSDPGRDVVTLRIDWGDGTASESLVGQSVLQRDFSATHLYLQDETNPNPVSTYKLVITATDEDGAATTTHIAHSVVWGNAVPAGNPDFYNLQQGGTLAALDATGSATATESDNGVLANDQDWEGDAMKAILVSGPGFAESFELLSDGSFTYVHDGSGESVDQFTYKPADGSGEGAPVLVTLQIQINQPPVAHPNIINGIVGRALKFEKSLLLEDDQDPEGAPLVLESIAPVSDEGVPVSLSDSGQWVLYETRKGITTDSFTYVVSDGEFSVTGTVQIVLSEFGGGTLNIKGQMLVNGELHFEVAGIPERRYQLQATTDLRRGWGLVTDAAAAGTASAAGEVLLIRRTPQPTEFYRVIEQ